MIESMTGFGSQEAKVLELGKIYIELKSTNHKAQEIIFHLPEGFSFLEDRIRKELEHKIQRGRILCTINIIGGKSRDVFVNKPLVREYLASLKYIKKEVHYKDRISLDTLINLPGVLSLLEDRALLRRCWPKLKILVNQALANLMRSRREEGRALGNYLVLRLKEIGADIQAIHSRFKKAVTIRLAKINTDEERSAFLKAADISEEIERLSFHLKIFSKRISGAGPVGKELDFIAQEIQREANTVGAKSFDKVISQRVIRIKSQAEKIREQLQNIE